MQNPVQKLIKWSKKIVPQVRRSHVESSLGPKVCSSSVEQFWERFLSWRDSFIPRLSRAQAVEEYWVPMAMRHRQPVSRKIFDRPRRRPTSKARHGIIFSPIFTNYLRVLRRNFCQPAKKQAKPANERGVRGPSPGKILDFCTQNMHFLVFLDSFWLKKSDIFENFSWIFLRISLSEDLIYDNFFEQKVAQPQ